ncbi:tRNA lysidine(34) synthetase TilS [candidate division WOR-3 bacterium]|nr:tRNA lysidine(34) synthetase TilS [candidate division WOR-3 bacterium]
MMIKKSERLIRTVEATIGEHRMFDGASKVLIAFSSGPDSICLLDVLHRLYAGKMEFELVYVNHGMRPATVLRREEAKTRAYAARYGAGCKILRVRVRNQGVGAEAAARQARYRALESYMEQGHAQRIALGHNLDDFVETFVLNMVRGSGLRGLASMPAKRLPYVRPLIDCEKKDILDYLKARRLSYAIDRTNRSLDHRRNIIRMKIVPVLRSINPEIHQTIRRAAQILKGDDEYIRQQAGEIYARAAKQEKDCILLDINTMMSYNPSVISRLVMKAIADLSGSLDGYESKHYQAIVSLTAKEHSKKISLPKGIYAQRERDNVVIGRVRPGMPIEVPIDINAGSVAIGDHVLRLKLGRGPFVKEPCTNREVFDLDKLHLPLYVRNKKPGDWIETKIGRKRLKKVYSEQRIVPRKRGATLLLCDQQGVLWVIGFVRAYRGFISGKTKKALAVEFERVD